MKSQNINTNRSLEEWIDWLIDSMNDFEALKPSVEEVTTDVVEKEREAEAGPEGVTELMHLSIKP